MIFHLVSFDATCRSFLLYIVSLQMHVENTPVPSVCFVLGAGLIRQKQALIIICDPSFLFGFQVLTAVKLCYLILGGQQNYQLAIISNSSDSSSTDSSTAAAAPASCKQKYGTIHSALKAQA